MCKKRGEFCGHVGEMIYGLNSFFNFHLKMFIYSCKRKISPQASIGFKIWEIDAIVGRLCQNFCKNLRRKLQQHKQAKIPS